MDEQASVSAAQKAELNSHLEELNQEIAQKDEEIRALEQQIAGATGQPQEDVHGRLSMAQQTRAAMQQNVKMIHTQLGSPAPAPSMAQTHQSGKARIY
ncbi:MAG: hypothetical protein H0X37_14665 [Herpetosiphonaceae bacterium]|nr:hypothetical protein [Herpetosiphonaceae bacterium]